VSQCRALGLAPAREIDGFPVLLRCIERLICNLSSRHKEQGVRFASWRAGGWMIV